MSHILIGRRIVTVCVDSSWNKLLLELDNGLLTLAHPIRMSTIQGFANSEALLSVVENVEEVYHRRDQYHTHGDWPRQWHECKITTGRGACTIDTGNNQLEWYHPEEPPYWDMSEVSRTYHQRHQDRPPTERTPTYEWVEIVRDNKHHTTPMSKRVK